MSSVSSADPTSNEEDSVSKKSIANSLEVDKNGSFENNDDDEGKLFIVMKVLYR